MSIFYQQFCFVDFFFNAIFVSFLFCLKYHASSSHIYALRFLAEYTMLSSSSIALVKGPHFDVLRDVYFFLLK